jgi:hypothetical protein
MRNQAIFIGMVVLFLYSCNTISCYKRVDTLADWLSSAEKYDCSKPEKLKSTFHSLCWGNKEDVGQKNPEGLIGSTVCKLCLDYPISKLNGFFEEAGCKKKVVSKTTRDVLINLCSSYLPFEAKE